MEFKKDIKLISSIVIIVIMCIVGFIYIYTLPVSTVSNKSNTSDIVAKQENEQKIKEEQKALAQEKTIQILKRMHSNYDEVEKSTTYDSFKSLSSKNNSIAWTVLVKRDGSVFPAVIFTTYNRGLDWAFWDKIIFSSNSDKFDYQMEGVFAGQSGGGKRTKIVNGGTLEYGLIDYSSIEKGIIVLTNGTNPIVRFSGDENIDYKIPQETIESLRTLVDLNEQLKILSYHIDINKLN